MDDTQSLCATNPEKKACPYVRYPAYADEHAKQIDIIIKYIGKFSLRTPFWFKINSYTNRNTFNTNNISVYDIPNKENFTVSIK